MVLSPCGVIYVTAPSSPARRFPQQLADGTCAAARFPTWAAIIIAVLTFLCIAVVAAVLLRLFLRQRPADLASAHLDSVGRFVVPLADLQSPSVAAADANAAAALAEAVVASLSLGPEMAPEILYRGSRIVLDAAAGLPWSGKLSEHLSDKHEKAGTRSGPISISEKPVPSPASVGGGGCEPASPSAATAWSQTNLLDLCASLRHPHVATVFGAVDVLTGVPATIREFGMGGTLERFLDAKVRCGGLSRGSVSAQKRLSAGLWACPRTVASAVASAVAFRVSLAWCREFA